METNEPTASAAGAAASPAPSRPATGRPSGGAAGGSSHATRRAPGSGPGGGRSGPRGGGEDMDSGAMKGRRRSYRRRKVCAFCVEKAKSIDYKNIMRIAKYLSDRGKIVPRRQSGTCAKHQRQLCSAIKRAREMALMPYIRA